MPLTHEDVYRTGVVATDDLVVGMTQYLHLNNGERMHQWLGNNTPGAVRRTPMRDCPVVWST